MAIIHRKLVQSLIEATTIEKEEIGNKIVLALGGDPTKQVTGLPARRGNSDGGIDGRVPILIKIISRIERFNPKGIPSPLYVEGVTEQEAMAAFCIKIENSNFNRYQMNAFVEDMRRERIFDGIIITAKPLSPDASSEMNRHNREGSIKICHLLLEDILAGNIKCNFKFLSNKSLKEILLENITSYLSS